MKRGILLISLGLLFCIVGFRLAPVWAVSFGFYSITNNVAGDVAIGEAQLFVDVTDAGQNSETEYNQALFTFRNIGTGFCSIAEIYFDDAGEILLMPVYRPVSIDDTEPGVAFSEIDPKQWNFPGGGINFQVEYGAGADEPPSKNGVNPSESLGILFELLPGFGFSDLLSDIGLGNTRIGMHVTAFAGGGSESFVNNLERTSLPVPEPVPEPATMLLLGVGLIGLAGIGRGKFRKSKT